MVRTEGNPSWIGFCLFPSCLGLPSALALPVSGCCCLLERPAPVEAEAAVTPGVVLMHRLSPHCQISAILAFCPTPLLAADFDCEHFSFFLARLQLKIRWFLYLVGIIRIW